MAVNFPDTPTVGQVFDNYTWDGEKWTATSGGGSGGGGISQADADVRYVNVIGDQMQDRLLINDVNPWIGLGYSGPYGGGIWGYKNTVTVASNVRWGIVFGGDAETGGNAGSTFGIERCSDAGGVLGYPFTIARATGIASFEASPLAPTPTAGDNSTKLATTAFVAAADALKEDKANKGAVNGYAPLDATSKVPAGYLPAFVDDVLEFANTAAFPAVGSTGVIYVALNTNKVYRWSGSAYIEISPSPGSTDAVPEGSINLYHTTARAAAAAPVQSVNTRTGAVTLTKADVGLSNVDNTSDAGKPVSTAQQSALDLKANLNSPVLTGIPQVPTPAANSNTAQIASTQWIQTWFVNDAPLQVPAAITVPVMDGIGAIGAISRWAKADHIHPSDTSREPTLAAGTAAQYYRGDKSWQTHDKASVGLGNVDNTSDTSKPVSTATQTALNLKEDKASKGIANGYASLDASAKVPAVQLPSFVDDVLEFANLAAFPVTGSTGVIYIALDTGKIYRWSGSIYVEISPSPGSTDSVPEGSVNLYHTTARASAAAPVQSVAGRGGAVVLTKADVGLGNVDNTTDLNKPISTATQTALNGKSNTGHTHLWADITDKPAAFPPDTHSHVAANVTDFSEAVDDRVSALLVQGANISLVYNDASNTLTINSVAGGTGDVTGPASAVADRVMVANGTTGKIIKDGGKTINEIMALPGYIAGLQLAWYSTTQIVIGPGVATDTTAAASMYSTGMVKSTAAWAAGSSNGGKDSSTTFSANSTYHWFIIRNPTTGVVDFIFSSSLTPTLPSGYTQYRRIGSMMTEVGSAAWVSFSQRGDDFYLTAPRVETAYTNPGTAVSALPLTGVPNGIKVEAKVFIALAGTGGAGGQSASWWACEPGAANDYVPNVGSYATTSAYAPELSTFYAGAMNYIWTTTARQIRIRLQISTAGTQLFMTTHGWKDNRGKDF